VQIIFGHYDPPFVEILEKLWAKLISLKNNSKSITPSWE